MIREIADVSRAGRVSLLDRPRQELGKLAGARRRDGFVWVSLVDPDEAELGEFARLLGLHPLATADAVTGKQQPKIQAYEEHLFVVIWGLSQSDKLFKIAISPTFLFVRDGLIVSVQRHGERGCPDLGPVLDDAFDELGHGVLAALYAIMRSFVEVYTDVADRVEAELEALETQVFDARTREDDRRIYGLRKQIGRIQRAVSGMSVALQTSQEHLAGLSVGRERVEPYFRDLLDDLAGTNQLVSDQDRALDGVLASPQNNFSTQQNADPRKIRAFPALLSVPAVLAGIFGMNFQNLPGVSWDFGWEVLIAVIIVLDAILFIAFKRRHWL